MSVRNVDVNPSGKYEQICGYAYQDAQHYPGDGGALLVHLEGTPVDSSYWLLDSDYHNYASVYSCFSILGLIKLEFAWVLLRDVGASQDVIDASRAAFTQHGLDISHFEIVDHSNCDYDPADVQPCN